MDRTRSVTYQLQDHLIVYDFIDGVLLCRRLGDKKNLWIKKIYERTSLEEIVEDEERFYLSFADSEREGQFLVLERDTGYSVWTVPGRPFFNQLYGDYVFLIFSDEKGNFYLLKMDRKNGDKIWHHAVSEGLCQYAIKRESISLTYKDGTKEEIAMETGKLLS